MGTEACAAVVTGAGTEFGVGVGADVTAVTGVDASAGSLANAREVNLALERGFGIGASGALLATALSEIPAFFRFFSTVSQAPASSASSTSSEFWGMGGIVAVSSH